MRHRFFLEILHASRVPIMLMSDAVILQVIHNVPARF